MSTSRRHVYFQNAVRLLYVNAERVTTDQKGYVPVLFVMKCISLFDCRSDYVARSTSLNEYYIRVTRTTGLVSIAVQQSVKRCASFGFSSATGVDVERISSWAVLF